MLWLKEEHRVVAANGCSQEAVRVQRVARHHDAQAGHVREHRLGTLRVVRRAALEVAAARDADNDGRGPSIAAAPAQGREFISDLLIRRPDIVEKLNLDDGLQAAHRHAERAADDVGLGER